MSYTKTVWEDLPSTNTPINATNLNKIENELETLDKNSNYSSIEQVIGTWKDGKPIYRKVLSISGTMSVNSWETVGTLSNVSTLVYAVFIDDVTNKAIWQDTNIRVNSGNIQYFSKEYAHTYTGLILEYTKTTD